MTFSLGGLGDIVAIEKRDIPFIATDYDGTGFLMPVEIDAQKRQHICFTFEDRTGGINRQDFKRIFRRDGVKSYMLLSDTIMRVCQWIVGDELEWIIRNSVSTNQRTFLSPAELKYIDVTVDFSKVA